MWPPATTVGRRRAISSTVLMNCAGSVIATQGLTIWAKKVKLSAQSSWGMSSLSVTWPGRSDAKVSTAQ